MTRASLDPFGIYALMGAPRAGLLALMVIWIALRLGYGRTPFRLDDGTLARGSGQARKASRLRLGLEMRFRPPISSPESNDMKAMRVRGGGNKHMKNETSASSVQTGTEGIIQNNIDTRIAKGNETESGELTAEETERLALLFSRVDGNGTQSVQGSRILKLLPQPFQNFKHFYERNVSVRDVKEILLQLATSTQRGRCILKPLIDILNQRVLGEKDEDQGMEAWEQLKTSCAPIVKGHRFAHSDKCGVWCGTWSTSNKMFICNLDRLGIIRCEGEHGEKRLHLGIRESIIDPNVTKAFSLLNHSLNLPLTLYPHPNEAKRQLAPYKVVFQNLSDATQQPDGNFSNLPEVGSAWRMVDENGVNGARIRIFMSRLHVHFTGLSNRQYGRWEDLMFDSADTPVINDKLKVNGSQRRRKGLLPHWVGNGSYPSGFAKSANNLDHKAMVEIYLKHRECLLSAMAQRREDQPKKGVRLSVLRQILPNYKFFTIFGVMKFVDFIKAIPEVHDLH
ncbi:hypothetical protein AAMO2058_001160400 [Amorphochlora amoebiformis]